MEEFKSLMVLGDETVSEPGGAGPGAEVPRARRQQAEAFMVGGVMGLFGLPPTSLSGASMDGSSILVLLMQSK